MSTPLSSRPAAWTSPVAFLGSLCTHALLAWLILTNLNSCGQQGNFGVGEEFREVGLYVLEDRPSEEESEQTSEATPTERLPDLPENLNQTLDEMPNLVSSLPDFDATPLIGPGPAPTGVSREDPAAAFLNAAQPPPLSAAGIPSTTKFFDIATRGQSIVYLIDCSGSMSKHNAFRHAKAELVASLERLDPNHKFQVLFYNDQFYEFRDRRGEIDIHWATAANLTLARAYISQFDNSGGTIHFPALMKALSYKPDVLFFLTDGADPSLSPRELEDIKHKNRGKTAIHCIEFGLGPDLLRNNFLKTLSSQNDGTYQYRDMSKLGS